MKKSTLNEPKFLFLGGAALFAFVATIDQLMKHWAFQLIDPNDFAFIRFFPYANGGVFGGYLADLDPWIIRIFFSVLFGFLSLGGFLIIHFLKHKEVPLLKWGIVFYLAGILGNVWDRMSTGQVVDFIIFKISFLEGMAFNFADFVVVTGFFMIARSILKDADALWYDNNSRKGHWVEPKFQMSFGILLALVGLAHFIVIALYSFTFLKVFLGGQDASGFDPDRIIFDYLVGLSIIETGALALTFGASVFFSHRMAGPLIALDHHLQRQLDGKAGADERLRLRDSDYFKEKLEAIASNVGQKIKNPSSNSPQ